MRSSGQVAGVGAVKLSLDEWATYKCVQIVRLITPSAGKCLSAHQQGKYGQTLVSILGSSRCRLKACWCRPEVRLQAICGSTVPLYIAALKDARMCIAWAPGFCTSWVFPEVKPRVYARLHKRWPLVLGCVASQVTAVHVRGLFWPLYFSGVAHVRLLTALQTGSSAHDSQKGNAVYKQTVLFTSCGVYCVCLVSLGGPERFICKSTFKQ